MTTKRRSTPKAARAIANARKLRAHIVADEAAQREAIINEIVGESLSISRPHLLAEQIRLLRILVRQAP